jgi:UDP-glucose 4-epimerase
VDESSPVEPLNPYGHTKAMVEQVLRDCTAAYPLRALSLRYFNPIGADPVMRTGQQLRRPTHALGAMIAAAADGAEFPVTGIDWPTRDGSGIRDYVHVWDLALAHRQALRRFDTILPPGGARYDAVNIGTGTGSTVRELLRDFEAVLGRRVAAREAPRRDGDSAGSYSRTERAHHLLDWRPTLTMADGIRHSLQWSRRRDIVLQ